MSILVHDGPGEPNPFERTPLVKAAEHKTEDGEQYPAEAFAYVPDPSMPSTWKLRLWSSPSEKATARQVGAAIAALGPGGFRGQRVDLPDEDRPKVVARVLAEWKRLHPGQEPPTALMKAFEPVVKHPGHNDQKVHGGKGSNPEVAQMASDAGVELTFTGVKGQYKGHSSSTRVYDVVPQKDGKAQLLSSYRGGGTEVTNHPSVSAARRAMVDREKAAMDAQQRRGGRPATTSVNWGSGEGGRPYGGDGNPAR